MNFKSLRFRLVLFYSVGVAVLLIIFGCISYFSLKESLFHEHDKSLEKHVNSLDHILKSKIYTGNIGKSQNIIIPKQSITELADSIIDIISTEIYDLSLIKPKNNFVQVISPGGTIIYESDNMGSDDLPTEDAKLNSMIYETLNDFKDQKIRLALYQDSSYVIAIGSPLKETEITLSSLFTIFSLLIPSTLIILIVGGWYITNRSLKPIDEISKTAQEITTKHLHMRIKKSKHDDEIGRLIHILNEMIDRLEKSFEKIQQFSSDASHELRTPLTILLGELQNALQGVKTNEGYQRIISNSIDEILSMSQIIEDLLTLYKADSDDLKFNKEKVSLGQLFNNLYEDIQILALGKNLTVTLEIKDDLIINGDRIRLRQLFLNLLENAVKFNKQDGKIDISSMQNDENIIVSIKDTGIGITPVDGDKIFDRFYRIDKSRARNVRGTGLGLSISKWIVEKHDGKIEYISEPDKGTTFFVYFPKIKKGG
jgi:two-component system, OmpR family, sensor kinase